MQSLSRGGANSSNINRYYIDEMDMEVCHRYAYQRWRCDFYATAIGVSLVVIFGVLGNAGTLFTLSGRRLATATFVYYRAIACVDLCRCIFVFTYVLRVLVPFRRYFWTSWYEAHLMYFVIGTLGFISTTLAVFLCFRLCYCIVQSGRMKKMHTNAGETRRIIYGVTTASFFINLWLCFERQVRSTSEDECSFSGEDTSSRNESDTTTAALWNTGGKKYALAPSEFSYAHSSLLKAVHNVPVVVLLVLLTSTLALLLLCFVAFNGVKQREILTNRDSRSSNSRTWRTQRQLCRLFLVLSLSYALGLLPSLIYEFFFNYDPASGSGAAQNNTTVAAASSLMFESQEEQYKSAYEKILAAITRRHMSATILNVFQNLAHAISFYIYVSCSEEFRNEFMGKMRRIGRQLRSAYSSFHFSRLSGRNSARSSPMSPLIAANMTPIPDRRLAGRGEFLTRPCRGTAEGGACMELMRVRVSRGPNAGPQRALLSENEGENWEELEPPMRRTQSDLRFCRRIGGIARELSCQFYTRVSTVKEQTNEENADGFCLVFEAATKDASERRS